MGITIPSIFTGIHDEEIQIGKPVTEQTLKKLIRNTNFLGDLKPIGSIELFNVNQAGFQAIDSNYYQLCDGSEIVNPNSPIRSIGISHNYVPNINEKYIRCAYNVTGNGTGGNQTFNFVHNHGGVTGNRYEPTHTVYDTEDNRRQATNHTHSISSSLTEVTVDYPSWYKVAAYLKIQ